MASTGSDTSVLYELVPVEPRTVDAPLRLRVTPAAVAVVFVGVIVGLASADVIASSRSVLALFVAATTGAVLIDPPVEFFARSMRRWLAIVVTLAIVTAIYVVVSAAVFGDLNHETARLQREAPRAAARLERDHEVARKFQLKKRVSDFVDNLHTRTSAKPQKAAERFGSYFVGGILMLFMLSWGPRFGAAAFAQIGDERRRDRWRAITLDALRRGRRYLLFTLVQALVVGVTVYAVCRIGNVPAPVALALLAAFGSALPYVGIVVGGVPALLLAGGFESSLTVEVLLATLIVLQLVQVFVVQPRLTRHSMYAGPALTVIVLLVGYDLYGLGGALYGLALAVFALAFVDAIESCADDDQRPPIRDFVPVSTPGGD